MIEKWVGLFMLLLLVGGMTSRGNADVPGGEVSLADLIHMGEVTVASKKAESVNEAPGIISIITAEEIKKYPVDNLYDMLKLLPGVNVMETFFGYTTISMRGIKETHYNNRTLLLLNGHALRDVTVGTHWLESVPINVIERIEVIRGPGSVMYGTGAFAGVINIVTKKNANLAEVTLKGGSYYTTDGSFTLADSQEVYKYLAGVSFKRDDGYPAIARDEAGNSGPMGVYPKDERAYQNNYYNLFGEVVWQGLQADVYYLNQDKDKFGLITNLLTTGQVNTEVGGLSLQYAAEWLGVAFTTQVYYDQSNYSGYVNLFPPGASGNPLEMKYSGYKSGANLDARVGLWENLTLLAGVADEFEKTKPYEFINFNTKSVGPYSPFLRDYDTNDLSLYAQLEYVPVSPLKVVGGVRFNQNRDSGSTLVPRVSAVYKVLEGLSIKLLYGAAYRDPTFFEKYVNTQDVLYGDPDLKPEKINTLECGADWSWSEILVRLAAFYLTTDDMIGRVKTYNPGDVPTATLNETRNTSTLPTRTTPGYGNTAGQEIKGLELELKGMVWPKLFTYGVNASYQDGKEKSDGSPIPYLDRFAANVILGNQVARFNNTLIFEYLGERKGNLDATTVAPGFTRGQEIIIPAYHRLNFKTAYQLLEHLELSLYVMNIFEEKNLYPEYIRKRIDVIPGDGGRDIYLQVRCSF